MCNFCKFSTSLFCFCCCFTWCHVRFLLHHEEFVSKSDKSPSKTHLILQISFWQQLPSQLFCFSEDVTHQKTFPPLGIPWPKKKFFFKFLSFGFLQLVGGECGVESRRYRRARFWTKGREGGVGGRLDRASSVLWDEGLSSVVLPRATVFPRWLYLFLFTHCHHPFHHAELPIFIQHLYFYPGCCVCRGLWVPKHFVS